MGRKIKESRYVPDKQIRRIDLQIVGFTNDTVYRKNLQRGDSLKIRLVGYKASGGSDSTPISLAESGYKIQSFVFSVPDSEMPGNSEYLNEMMVRQIVSKGYYSGDRFFMSNLIIIDPHGKKYQMPLKTFLIR